MKAKAQKPRTTSPRATVQEHLWADLLKKLADHRAHLARVEQMIQRDKVRWVRIRPTVVKEHTRVAHWRPVYIGLTTRRKA